MSDTLEILVSIVLRNLTGELKTEEMSEEHTIKQLSNILLPCQCTKPLDILLQAPEANLYEIWRGKSLLYKIIRGRMEMIIIGPADWQPRISACYFCFHLLVSLSLLLNEKYKSFTRYRNVIIAQEMRLTLNYDLVNKRLIWKEKALGTYKNLWEKIESFLK